MSRCTEVAFRESLNDGEFWDYVLNGIKPGDVPVEPEIDDEPIEEYGGPCAICGERGPCGYDAEGRPLIHPTYVAEE